MKYWIVILLYYCSSIESNQISNTLHLPCKKNDSYSTYYRKYKPFIIAGCIQSIITFSVIYIVKAIALIKKQQDANRDQLLYEYLESHEDNL